MTWYGVGLAGSAWRASCPSPPTMLRSSVTSRTGVRSASIGGATTSGRRSGPAAKQDDALKLSRTPGRVGPVPTPGQDTDEVLEAVLGLDHAAIQKLRADRVVA
jgi:hypothetical protein